MTTYYVRKTGSDGNDGRSPSTAFMTIQRAIDVASNGEHTIYVGAGTYNENVVVAVSGESPTARFQIVADYLGQYCGDFGDVVISGTILGVSGNCFEVRGSYIHIGGFICSNYDIAVNIENPEGPFPTDVVLTKLKIFPSERKGVVLNSKDATFYILRCLISAPIEVRKAKTLYLYNNSFTGSETSESRYVEVASSDTTLEVLNCLFFDPKQTRQDTAIYIPQVQQIISDYNDYYVGTIVNTPSTAFSDLNHWRLYSSNDKNSLVVHPRVFSDYTLMSDSPLIDRGTTGVPLQYFGGAPDIGAFDFWPGIAPSVFNPLPRDGDRNILPMQAVSFSIDDPEGKVIKDLLSVQISDSTGQPISAVENGEIQEGFSGSITKNGTVYSVSLSPEIPFSYGQKVDVYVRIICNNDAVVWTVYSFEIVGEAQTYQRILETVKDIDVFQVTDSGKYDLRTTFVGHVNSTVGRQSLVNQLARAILNEDVVPLLFSSPVERISSILRDRLLQFRTNQIMFEFDNVRNVVGYNIAKYDYLSGDFYQMNDTPVTRSFIDTNVMRGIPHYYRIYTVYEDTSESFPEGVKITPDVKPDLYTTTKYIVSATERQVEFIFRQNRYFLASGLLESIESIDVEETADPRGIIITAKVKTLDESILFFDRFFEK